MMRSWQFAALVLAAAAAALAIRLPDLDHRPMHTDEAVHTFKFRELWETGRYHYDVHDYHGPTLYYLTLPVVWLSGADRFAETTAITYRLVPVIVGAGLVVLLLLVGDGLGRWAAVAAAALTIVSPALVYYSRYYIQETLLVFFTFGLIGAGWRYGRSRRLGYALAAGVCAGLMHATKETAVLAYACLVAAAAVIMLSKCRRRSVASAADGANQQLETTATAPNAWRLWGTFALACLPVAVLVSVACFSAGFQDQTGPLESIRAYGAYLSRAGHGVHHQPWHYYISMLVYTHHAGSPIWSEGFILGLACIGIAAGLTGRSGPGANRDFVLFVSIYTLLMLIVYSAIPYKTPWCALEFLQPLILLAGVGATTVVRWARWLPLRLLVVCLLLAGVAHLGTQARAASARYASDNRNPYAYAHPVNDVKRLGVWIDWLAVVHPQGRNMMVKVISSHPWPLPWYLRGFERVGYYETVPEDARAAVIIADAALHDEVMQRLDGPYFTSHYGLRPGTSLVVYVDQSLYDAFAERERARVQSGPVGGSIGEDGP